MSTITVTTVCGTEREFDSRREAEQATETHRSLCDECGEDDVEIALQAGQPSRPPTATDGRDAVPDEADAEAAPGDGSSLPDDIPGSVQTDPLDVVPEYMVTEVDGQPTINKRGYAVIANHFDIVVQSEAITTAGETDHEYAEFKATAWQKDNGPEQGYTGHATARVSEDRRGIENNLNEMAETRAMKRGVAWASGVGILAWEEMVEYLEE
jgi:hypothetical protein